MEETNLAPLNTFLVNNFGDKYLYEVNHNSLNKIGANNSHKQRFKTLLSRENALIIIVGTDSGTLISYLNNTDIPSGSRVILLELDALYDIIKKETPPDPENKQIIYTKYEKLDEIYKSIQIQHYIYIGNIQLAQSLGAEDAFIPEYQELFYTLQTDLQQLSWNIEASLGSEPFLIKQLENLGENLIPSFHLRNSFTGKTAVLLAGGPSLDEILPWVKEQGKNVVTMAVSRVCRRLLEVDFKPDIIFSIDPHQVSFDVSKEMLSFWQDSLFIHMYHVTPLLLGQWQGKNVFLGSRVPWKSDLNKESLPHPGPTVSNVALSTAIEMGFSQIILAGVDLCHSKTGLTHASGSNEVKAGPQLSKVCTQIETNGGWLAETTSDFAAAIDILDDQAKGANKKNVTLINPSPGSARIKHIEYIPLNEIKLKPLDEAPEKTLHSILPEISTDTKKTYYKKAIKDLAKTQGQLLHIKKLTTEAIRCNDGLFGRNGIQQNFKYKKRMDKIENSLNKKYTVFSRLVKSFGIREFLKLTRIDKEAEWEDSEIEKTAKNYYEAYSNSASILIKLIRSSKKRLESRLDELSDSPNIEKLIEQWQKDRQPGRALIWLKKNNLTLSQLPQKQRNAFQKLLDNFQQVLDNTDTDHMKRSRQFAELTGVRGKAQAFFRQKNIEALQQLIRSLELHPDKKAERYLFLAKGYLFELEEKYDHATDEYQKLFSDMEDPLMEDCLRRIASISISRNDRHNGLLALESLSHMSPAYLPQYADMLRLTGAHQDAINTYLDYLEKVPNDLTTMIRVGQFYKELNIPEGAKVMFEHVLEKDPTNEAVQLLLQGIKINH